MAIVGGNPDSGMRVEAERPRASGPPWRYEGQATTDDACFRLVATVDAEGAVDVEVGPEAPAGLADRVRLMLRTAWRRAHEDGLHPPLRLSRWRADV